jgi:hypothetical protein
VCNAENGTELPTELHQKAHLADSPSFIKLHTEFSLEINLNVTSDFRSQKNFCQLG